MEGGWGEEDGGVVIDVFCVGLMWGGEAGQHGMGWDYRGDRDDRGEGGVMFAY